MKFYAISGILKILFKMNFSGAFKTDCDFFMSSN